MSKYSDYIKSMKEKDLTFFFGEVTHITNKYFEFKRVIDNDNIIVITENIKVIKDSYVLIIDNNKAVYLKDWQVRSIHNYDNGINAYAVKLNRKYFKPYTFRFEFDGFDFDHEMNFDEMFETAMIQQEENMQIACGHMN